MLSRTYTHALYHAATHEPYPYSSDDYLEVRLTTVRYNDIDGTVPSATIVLNRVENGDTHMDHDLALSVGGAFVHALSNQMTRSSARPPRPTALDLLWKVRASSPGIRIFRGFENQKGSPTLRAQFCGACRAVCMGYTSNALLLGQLYAAVLGSNPRG